MFPGPYTTDVAIDNASPSNTSWYNTRTAFQAPTTTTQTRNATTASSVAARTSHCPLTLKDILNGLIIYDLPDACVSLLEPYCWPDPDKPILPSTRSPVVCTPARVTATSARSPTDTKPSPIQPSTVASCTKYYPVLGWGQLLQHPQ